MVFLAKTRKGTYFSYNITKIKAPRFQTCFYNHFKKERQDTKAKIY